MNEVRDEERNEEKNMERNEEKNLKENEESNEEVYTLYYNWEKRKDWTENSNTSFSHLSSNFQSNISIHLMNTNHF